MDENPEIQKPADPKPLLYLIPTILAAGTELQCLSAEALEAIKSTRLFFVENLRTARRFISKIGHPQPIESLKLYPLEGSTTQGELNTYIHYLKQAGQAGVLSEAGCPGIADPGADLVATAYMKGGITVKPLTGPCSFVLALMASGLNGQSFAFAGYLPQKSPQLGQALRLLEQESVKKKQTQIFMDTPYRNKRLLEEILLCCSGNTLLCLAVNLTAPDEFIATMPVSEWKKLNYSFPEKVPAVFLLLKRV